MFKKKVIKNPFAHILIRYPIYPIRGGIWEYGNINRCRCSNRDYEVKNTKMWMVGYRICLKRK